MKVFSFQLQEGITRRDYDAQDVKIYNISSLDHLVEDYHQAIDNYCGGNIEMFMEEYDNNPNYENNNYPEAYLEMIQHPMFSKLKEDEKEDYNLPVPLSVEKIKSFNLEPGQFHYLRRNYNIICHELIENQDLNSDIVFTIQTESQVQNEETPFLFQGKIYSSLETAIQQFNQQLHNDFKLDRIYYQKILNENPGSQIELPEFNKYQDVYDFF